MLAQTQQAERCSVYEAFGDCIFGVNCKRSHNVTPYQTQKTIGTVVSKAHRKPGVMEVHTVPEKGTSTTRCYVAQGLWFSAGASSGDLVEIIISEKTFEDSDLRQARITKVLERRRQPHISSVQHAQYKAPCPDFMTYAHCEKSTTCSGRHDIEGSYKQSFYIAKVLSVVSTGMDACEVEVASKDDSKVIYKRKYRLPERNVTRGNLIILQVSSRTYQHGIHYGKVAAILHCSQELTEHDIPLELTMKFGFMFKLSLERGSKVPGRQNFRAYSVESCSDHISCKRIGIHVRAVALGQHFIRLDKFFMPFYRSKSRRTAKGFNSNVIRLAVSVYAHSASDLVDGPILTPLFISPGSAFTIARASEYAGYLEDMWQLFARKSFLDNAVNSLASYDMATNPDSWREKILVREMNTFFNKAVVRFLGTKEGKFVIARNISVKRGITAQNIVIPAGDLRMIQATWDSPHSTEERERTLGLFLGSAKRTEEEYWEEMIADRYLWEVLSCDHLQDKHYVVATYPNAQIVDFLNQQTLLLVMISPNALVYSENDLSGILVPRYHTPAIFKSVVRRLSKRLMQIQLCEIFGRRRGNPILMIQEVFHSPILSCSSTSGPQHDAKAVDADDQSISDMSLILKGLSCEEYCNSRLVRLSTERVAELARTSIEHGVEASKIQEDIRELIDTKFEFDSPYEKHEDGTVVSLSRGVELQLQVSLEEDDMEFGYWLRLLRVGKDCHLCLIHLNTPGRAFLRSRRDLKNLITDNCIEELRIKIASNGLKTITLKEITIKWNDVYFSGGTFISAVSIKCQSFLCIRKEIVGDKENTKFVWTCHAVVSEVSGNEVTFLSCTLFQDLTADMLTQINNGLFLVEILNADDNLAGLP